MLQAPSLDDKVDFHFIAFVEHDGRLYELDGRKSGPVDCGKIDGDFLSVSEWIMNFSLYNFLNHGFSVCLLT